MIIDATLSRATRTAPLHDPDILILSREAPATTGAITGRARPARPERYAANEEPPIDDLLGDPILSRLMASDGVRREHLLAVVETARARLGGAQT